MTKDTHTPGPWKTRDCSHEHCGTVTTGTHMSVDIHDSVCPEADARLIAAAPELLDVLTMALPYVEMAEHDDSYKPGVVAKMVQRMNNAIAAATGGAA